jgi:hypothetical protein
LGVVIAGAVRAAAVAADDTIASATAAAIVTRLVPVSIPSPSKRGSRE